MARSPVNRSYELTSQIIDAQSLAALGITGGDLDYITGSTIAYSKTTRIAGATGLLLAQDSAVTTLTGQVPTSGDQDYSGLKTFSNGINIKTAFSSGDHTFKDYALQSSVPFVDTSGAGLNLINDSGNWGRYVHVGIINYLSFRVKYPVTTSELAASISIPEFNVSIPSSELSTIQAWAPDMELIGVPRRMQLNVNRLFFRNQHIDSPLVTNADLSGKEVIVTGFYFV